VRYIDPDGRILRISGSRSYVKKVMNDLRKIDPNVSVSLFGVVTTRGKNTPGSNLITRLQTSKHTITIQNGESIGTRPKSYDNAITIGKGTDSTVTFSADNIGSPRYHLKDKNENIYLATVNPSEIVLGHELIHALHNAEGTREADHTDYIYQIDGFINGEPVSGESALSRSTGTAFPREEAKTIGLGEYSNNSITENTIRRQLGYDERIEH